MKVAIVIGHHVEAQGAYGNFGQSEWQFNDALMSEMAQRDMLQSDGIEVYVLYHDSSIRGYGSRVKAMHNRIDELGCKVSIELHFNSFHKPANGNEVLYCSANGKKVADIFDEELDSLPNRDRGVKQVTKEDRGGGFCCRGKSYAIILEPFFGMQQTEYIYGGQNRMSLMTSISNGLKRLKDIE